MNRADAYVRTVTAADELALTGPSPLAQAGRSPVRGDLAHIRLAWLHFVPHYAVPMPHKAGSDGATLRAAGQADAEIVCALGPGTGFAVLDMAGGWAWGQIVGEDHGDDGPVGYIALEQLETAAA